MTPAAAPGTGEIVKRTIVRALSDAQAVALALIENIQREQLTSAEEARALRRLVTDFSLAVHRHGAERSFICIKIVRQRPRSRLSCIALACCQKNVVSFLHPQFARMAIA